MCVCVCVCVCLCVCVCVCVCAWYSVCLCYSKGECKKQQRKEYCQQSEVHFAPLFEKDSTLAQPSSSIILMKTAFGEVVVLW